MEPPKTLLFVCTVTWSLISSVYSQYNVMNYGAIGDGIANDNQAFSAAWTAACGAGPGASMIVPGGRTFLVSAITFLGPCSSPSIVVQVDGNILAPTMEQWGEKPEKNGAWISFSGVDGLVVTGSGQFNGQGSAWWKKYDNNDSPRPRSLAFESCNNLQISGITSIDSPKMHMRIKKSNGVTVSNIRLMAPWDSPNTDGIDISEGSNFQISDSVIATGDDCIAIGGGTSFVNITRIACGPGHGISIGSLGVDGKTDIVEGVQVSQCSFTSTTNGARIKTWQGGSGYARRISFSDIRVDSVKNPIIIDQYYCATDSSGCKSKPEAVEVSDVVFDGFTGSSCSDEAITLKCSQSVACTGIVLNNIQLTSARCRSLSSTIINAHGTANIVSPSIVLSP